MKPYLAALLIAGFPAAVEAGPPKDGWRLDLPVTVTSGTYLQRSTSGSARLDALWGSAGIELSVRRGRWKTALFAEGWFSAEEAMHGVRNTGVSVNFDADRVDWLVVAMHSEPRSGPGAWPWMARARYALVPRHKFGAEFLGDLERPGRGRLSVGYWATITERLSARVVAGADVRDFEDYAARVELCWEFN